MKLEVEAVRKAYPTPRGPLVVLENLSLALNAGDAAAIMGPSGTGKSTLLYILGALEAPTSGTVRLGGRSVFDMKADELSAFRNAEVGFVFQDHCLLPQCSVLENILLPALVAPADHADRYEDRARLLIDQVGLRDRMDHRPSQLSGGEKQRVAIARALIRKPRLVVCDEPTGNLDEATADTVSSLLLDLHKAQNNILLVVTHSPRVAARFPLRFELSQRQLRRTS